MDIDLPTNDNQLTDTNTTEDFKTHAQTDDETMETEQQTNFKNTNNNIDTPDNDEQTDNTTLDMHEQTNKTTHMDQQNPCTPNTNNSHTDNNNTAHPNLTPPQNTDNRPLPPKHTLTRIVILTSLTYHLT